MSAPTGSGKTLAAFLSTIDALFREGTSLSVGERTAGDGCATLFREGAAREQGTGHREQGTESVRGIEIVYVSPLKALSSDIQRNLEAPLAEIREVAREMGIEPPEIRTALRTGDTTQAQRAAILRNAPHILITTPESLYLMVTAERSRRLLSGVRTIIVDELHALMRDKRGSHLMLTLARLDALCAAAGSARPVRVGLSATVHPIELAARYLVGRETCEVAGEKPADCTIVDGSDPVQHPVACTIVDVGHRRDLDLAVEVPPEELQAVASAEQWRDTYDRIAALISEHRTTLVFVNTRRLAERVAHNLQQRLGEEHVAAHHGSLSKERRLLMEQRLKDGEMRAVVATASLELGIDVGTVDLVCQIGSPRAITTFLQRIGRSGHALGRTSKGRLFATSRDELVECAALIRAVRRGVLDAVEPPVAPLDILAQQMVAECACREWGEDALFEMVRQATPYAGLERRDYDEIVEMLSEGVAPRVGRGRALLHRDQINRTLKGRRAARITALTAGGAIPELADYRVVLDPDETFIGTVNEDWAIESMAGDVFLLGSHSWKIRRVESGRGVLRVEDAQGRPPSVPFWLGEAPGRTWELSGEVSDLRREVASRVEVRNETWEVGSETGETEKRGSTREWLRAECGVDESGAEQIARYAGAEVEALGVVPSDTDIVFERFFDDAGGMQLVVHAPFGSRVNRAFGLALRKRFCVRFDFELQAAADDNAVVLSMGPQHSFPLEDAFQFVRADNLRPSLEQAILYAPMWGTRWRWNSTRALQVLRSNGGKQVPPPIQRMRADDLLAAVFPLQVGCQENVSGPLELPDHPLIKQTVVDCLYEAMDIDRLHGVLERIEAGEIRLHARDTTEPSPFAHELLNGSPFTFLDNAPLEERRTRAVSLRRTLPESQRDLGVLDLAAIERVRDEARPAPRDADELHDLLLLLMAVPATTEWAQQAVSAATLRAPLHGELAASGDGGSIGAEWAQQAVSAATLRAPLHDELAASGDGGSIGAEWAQQAAPLHDELTAAGRGGMVGTAAGELWFAAEHLRAIEVLYPGAEIAPRITLPAHLDGAAPAREEAVLAAVRGHMEYLGPATAAQVAAMLSLGEGEVTSALAWLEGEGVVLRGLFTPRQGEPSADLAALEWCDRRLLARIHRLTLDRLRSEIEPVGAQDYMRYLFARQHVAGGRRQEGKRGVLDAIAQLQGFEISAVAWERDVLPSRVLNYDPRWLDEMALAGEVAWARLSLKKTNGAGRASSPQRATPITLAMRRDLGWLLESVRGVEEPQDPATGAAAATLDALRQHGALFFDDLAAASRQLPVQLEEALWDLVARGLVTGDGFSSLRQIMAPSRHRVVPAGSSRARAARRHSRYGGGRLSRASQPQGRWSIVHRYQPEPSAADELAERVARQLLARYGVVFRDVVARENFAVAWRDVIRALRRMEMRGDVRGGRFVSGFVGEQYALPEAVDGLRRVRREERTGETVRVNAADPLNLAGIITPGPRVASVHTNAVIYRDGVVVAVEEGRKVVSREEPVAT
ncbi:MAG TPA: DEAD/DEAH box helicase [Dehalococcoidia bacterium]|nr:DEAD/DEAH box helicase [Dehalococcoidia bacterium]